MKITKTLVGVYDEKANDLVFIQAYANFEVGCREIFRQVWRDDFKVANYLDDYRIIRFDNNWAPDDKEVYPCYEMSAESCTLRDLAQRYGVM